MRVFSIVCACIALAAVPGVAMATFGPGMPSCGGAHTIPPLSVTTNNPQLVQAQVFIRHGDRSPVDDTKCWNDDTAVWSCTLSQNEKNSVTMNSTVAVDRMYDLAFIPNREALPGSCGLGQLTTVGQSQQLQNGENLRKAYVDSGVLPADYFGNEDKFFLRSDNSQRTVQSGQALFTGMYPPAGDGTTEEVAWNVMDRTYDPMGWNKVLCPALTGAIAEYSASATAKNFSNTYLPFADKLVKEIGATPSGTMFTQLQTCGVTHGCHGHAVPTLIKEDWQQILDVSFLQWKLMMSFGNVSRFAIGPLVGKIWNNMQDVMSGDSDAKPFRLISGHDLAPLVPLLYAFKIDFNQWTWYASMISFELYKVGSSWAVRMVFNGKEVPIPGCSSVLCDIAEFASVAEAIIPTSEECKLTVTPPAPKHNINNPFSSLKRHIPAGTQLGFLDDVVDSATAQERLGSDMFEFATRHLSS